MVRELAGGIVQAQCPACAEGGHDRTGDSEGIGLRSLSIEGALRMVFDPLRPKPVVPQFVQAMLARVGTYQGRRSGSVPLIRV